MTVTTVTLRDTLFVQTIVLKQEIVCAIVALIEHGRGKLSDLKLSLLRSTVFSLSGK